MENGRDISSEMRLEEGFESLDAILEKLENPDISLEDSFVLYSQGMQLLKKCEEQIDRVEKQVMLLAEDGTTSMFDEGEEG